MLKDHHESVDENMRIPVHKGMKRNAKICKEGKSKVFIKSTAQIQKGEEIFVDYGVDYWM